MISSCFVGYSGVDAEFAARADEGLGAAVHNFSDIVYRSRSRFSPFRESLRDR